MYLVFYLLLGHKIVDEKQAEYVSFLASSLVRSTALIHWETDGLLVTPKVSKPTASHPYCLSGRHLLDPSKQPNFQQKRLHPLPVTSFAASSLDRGEKFTLVRLR